jgi:hypothetical protein
MRRGRDAALCKSQLPQNRGMLRVRREVHLQQGVCWLGWIDVPRRRGPCVVRAVGGRSRRSHRRCARCCPHTQLAAPCGAGPLEAQPRGRRRDPSRVAPCMRRRASCWRQAPTRAGTTPWGCVADGTCALRAEPSVSLACGPLRPASGLLTRRSVQFRDTSLHQAARWGNPGVARLLLDARAEVDARNEVGLPLLMHASHSNALWLRLRLRSLPIGAARAVHCTASHCCDWCWASLR